ncbi:MAG: glycine cleavage system protein GcvH [Candidatus Gastranaerophilaceae bacterium]|nr:glycine cleavage system protein GcvH [Christensenellales bacterium]
MIPTDRKYTKEHEWILVQGNVAKIGITDHAQEAMGDIVYVELPAIDDEFSAGDSLAVVESVKAVSQIYTQIAGKVVEVNEALDDSPEILNSDPYGNFIAAIESSSIDEDEFLSADEYSALLLAGE